MCRGDALKERATRDAGECGLRERERKRERESERAPASRVTWPARDNIKLERSRQRRECGY